MILAQWIHVGGNTLAVRKRCWRCASLSPTCSSSAASVARHLRMGPPVLTYPEITGYAFGFTLHEAVMSRWIEGRVVSNRRWTNQLYSLQIDAAIAPFKAGQFTRLGLDIEGERIGRPYSFVNAPHERYIEIYSIIVPGGLLSIRLFHLQPGDLVWVAPMGAGFFTLSEVPEGRYLWMLSTGTALGPFLAMLKTDEPWSRFEKIVLVHAVRRAAELTYQDTIGRLLAAHPDQLKFIPFVSRENTDFAIKGRIPQAIEDGRLEQKADIPLTADNSQVMICGNPAMVNDTTEVLMARGLKKNKRKEKGHITTENYW
jgi:ferredoxin--NADP+ reductase